MPSLRTTSPYLLVGLLAVAGTTHLLQPAAFDGLVPPALPGSARTWTLGSGIAELVVAGLVLAPRTRRVGGLAAAALFVAVFPGNVWMAVEPGGVPRWAALARLPLQVPLVLWGLQVAEEFPSTARRARRAQQVTGPSTPRSQGRAGAVPTAGTSARTGALDGPLRGP